MKDIHTVRLRIRNFVPEDWKNLQEIIIDRETSEYAIYDHQLPTSDDEIKKIAGKFAKNDRFLAVCDLTGDKIIGYISLIDNNTMGMDLGYCFNSLYHGKGYATEACTAVIHYAFSTLHVEKITAGTANQNNASYRLLHKLGFQKTTEHVCSFRKTPEGKPIEFVGSSFVLERCDWMKENRYPVDLCPGSRSGGFIL